MKRPNKYIVQLHLKATMVAIAACFAQTLQANPANYNVTNGSAVITSVGNTMTITNTSGAIINWGSFSINAGETVNFIQSAQSTVLNRVVGDVIDGQLILNPSSILGSIKSDGRVFLINPSGIMFGQGSIVDVNGLVASTLNINDNDFINNRLNFTGSSSGSVVNQAGFIEDGVIKSGITTPTGGSVYLIGHNVSNEGIISSPNGEVILAAGNSVSLLDTGTPHVTVTLSATNNQAINLGTITAESGNINIYGALINQQGIIRADSASVDAQGNIILKATDTTTVSGTLSATNSQGKGGTIEVLGNNVTLTDTAFIDASGATGGGTVLVGGDYQGKNSAIQNALNTNMMAGAAIHADATNNGNGGKVILWSDNHTDFSGDITARGGANGGDGGFVETSGHTMDLRGRVNTLAPMGKTGNYLIDPVSVCVNATGSPCIGAGYSSAITNLTFAFLQSTLDTTNAYLQATDFIAFEGTFTLDGTAINNILGYKGASRDAVMQAPHIYMNGVFDAQTGPNMAGKAVDLTLEAVNGTTSIGGMNGTLLFASLSGLRTNGGHAYFTAASQIIIASGSPGFMDFGISTPLPQPDNTQSSLYVKTPSITGGGTLMLSNFDSVDIMTDNLGANINVTNGGKLNINVFTTGKDIYLGPSPNCATSLCIDNQIGASPGQLMEMGIGGDNEDFTIMPGDIYVEATISMPAQRYFIATANGTIYLNAPTPQATGIQTGPWASPISSGFFSNSFINNYGANAIPDSTYGHWIIFSRDPGTTQLGGLIVNALSTPLDYKNITLSDLESLFGAALSSGNVVNYWGAAFDPCTLNPDSCALPATKPVDQTPVQNITDPQTGEATGDITYDPTLKLAGADGEIVYGTGDNKIAANDTNGSIATARTEAKNAESEAKKAEAEATEAEAKVKSAKTPQNMAKARKQADEKKAEAEEKKAHAEVKKAEAEAKEAEAEVKTAKSATDKTRAEVKKSTAEGKKAEAESKKAEIEVKKTEAEVKQAESNTKKAEAEAKSARTPEAKAQAKAKSESSKAEAESKKAEVSAKKAEVQAKKAEAEAKSAEAEEKSAKTPAEKTKAEVKKTSAEGKKAVAESKKAEAEAKKADVEAKQSEGDAKKAEAEAKSAKSPEAKARAKDKAESSKSEAESKKSEVNAKKAEAESKKAEAEAKSAEVEEKTAKTSGEKAKAEVKRTEAESKKASAESKKAEAESKKADVEAKQAEGEAKSAKSAEKKDESAKRAESKKAESEHKKAEAESKKAEAESKKAESESKKAESEAKEAKSASKKVEAEKKAESKKAEAEHKKAESEKKKEEEVHKKAVAEKKEAEHKKAEEHRKEVATKSFVRATVASMTRDTLKGMLEARHEYKADTLKPALTILDRNPAAADLPACGTGADLCIPQPSAQVGTPFTQAAPTLSFLPQIQRKVAVVIGINQYQDKNIPALEGAVPDANAVGKMFKDQMGYDVRVVHDGTKADIVNAINQIATDVGPNDSVTVYYAGHGFEIESTKTGYWIPSDGSSKSPANWISNSDVNKMLRNIPAKQVMLVSDSCFSGTLAKEQKVSAIKTNAQDILGKRSVLVMSSGGEEPVSDEGRDGHSVFAWHFMDAMKNVDRYEQGSKMHESIKAGINKDGFPQASQYGASVSAGHTVGGDYLFEVRKY